MSDRLRAGLAAGASLSALAVATMFAGWKLAGLPFPPFDLFDWLARMLPGSIVTLWIDSAITVLRALHAGSTAAAAKNAEQTIAIASFIAAGTAIGAAAFAALQLSNEPATLLGGVLGGALGVGTLVVEHTLARVETGVRLDAAWVFATFVGWGAALGYVHDGWRAAGAGATGESAPIAGASADGDRADAVAANRTRATGTAALDRRRFLIRLSWVAALGSAIAAVCGAAFARGRATLGARWSDTHALPNANAAVQPAPGTRPELTPLERHYRVDIDTRPPRIDATSWRLRITGLVDRPLELSLDDLRREEPLNQFITLECISNPLGGDLIGTTRWTGVSLHTLLASARPHAGATHAKVTSADGFFEVISLDTAQTDPRVMLAYAWDDVPLMMEHGFPLRLYVPDVFGMKQPKWITGIEIVSRWEPGYWVLRGWDREARVAATSVVDTAIADAARGVVLAGGIAYAGARGISRVEARMDEGEWIAADLREPISGTTWSIWRAELRAGSGQHDVSVRCFDGANLPQPPPFHSRRVSV